MTNKTAQQMTDKHVQQIVARAIADAQIESGRCYHVCWWEGRLQCLHVRHTKEHHPSFYAANGYVFIDGLNAHQWQLVTSRVMDFCRTHRITLRGGSGPSEARKASLSGDMLQITEFDSRRLRDLIAGLRLRGVPRNAHLDQLEQMLESAHTVASEEVPENVVTMNSRVRLRDGRKNEEMTCSLVFPVEAPDEQNDRNGSISVLSAIGVSILGRQVGQTVGGRIRVEEMLYQPEAAGDFHL